LLLITFWQGEFSKLYVLFGIKSPLPYNIIGEVLGDFFIENLSIKTQLTLKSFAKNTAVDFRNLT